MFIATNRIILQCTMYDVMVYCYTVQSLDSEKKILNEIKHSCFQLNFFYVEKTNKQITYFFFSFQSSIKCRIMCFHRKLRIEITGYPFFKVITYFFNILFS